MSNKSCIRAALFAALFVLFAVPCAFAKQGVIKGRVMNGGDPVAGASVCAYDDPAGLFTGDSVAGGPVVSDAEGRFEIELKRGYYYMAAVKRADGKLGRPGPGEMYSFYGGNPIASDPARPAEITLNMVVKPPAQDDKKVDGDHGGVEGIVTFDGKPLDGVRITVYLDDTDSFRGMGYYMSPPTGVDGSFKLRMSEGTYYVVARKRSDGGMAGPLKEGDYFGYLDINPVEVRKGVLYQVELPVVQKVERAAPGGHDKTLVKGVIRDAEGNPVPFAYACLYKNPEMMDRPAFVSKPTGPDGAFIVEIPLGGTFYLAARDTIGGPVEPGQLYGRYNGNPEHSFTVETGTTVEGFEIMVEPTE